MIALLYQYSRLGDRTTGGLECGFLSKQVSILVSVLVLIGRQYIFLSVLSAWDARRRCLLIQPRGGEKQFHNKASSTHLLSLGPCKHRQQPH